MHVSEDQDQVLEKRADGAKREERESRGECKLRGRSWSKLQKLEMIAIWNDYKEATIHQKISFVNCDSILIYWPSHNHNPENFLWVACGHPLFFAVVHPLFSDVVCFTIPLNLGLRKSRVVLFRVDLRMRPRSKAIDVIGGVIAASVTGIVFRSDICSLLLTSGPEFVTVSGRLSAAGAAVVALVHRATLSQVEL